MPVPPAVEPANTPGLLDGTAPERCPAHQTAVWFVDVQACGPALAALDNELGLVPQAEHDRIQNTTPSSHLAVRVAAHRALRLALRGMFGAQACEAPFEQQAHTKPRLPDLSGDFSLSHSGGAALIGVTRADAIGVDLEAPRSVRLRSERRALIEQAGEQFAGGAQLTGDGDARTLMAWVRLEAIAKAKGSGMARLLTQMGAMGGAPSPETVSATQDSYQAFDLALPGEYLGAVALPIGIPSAPPPVFTLPPDLAALRNLANVGRESAL